MTSTLLNAIARVITRARGIDTTREGPSLPGAAWITYGLGALGGAFAERAWHAGIIAFPPAIVLAVAAIASPGMRQER